MRIRKSDRCFICNKFLGDKTDEECCPNAFVDNEQEKDEQPELQKKYVRSTNYTLYTNANNNINV